MRHENCIRDVERRRKSHGGRGAPWRHAGHLASRLRAPDARRFRGAFRRVGTHPRDASEPGEVHRILSPAESVCAPLDLPKPRWYALTRVGSRRASRGLSADCRPHQHLVDAAVVATVSEPCDAPHRAAIVPFVATRAAVALVIVRCSPRRCRRVHDQRAGARHGADANLRRILLILLGACSSTGSANVIDYDWSTSSTDLRDAAKTSALTMSECNVYHARPGDSLDALSVAS
jgi:hypothetical protein